MSALQRVAWVTGAGRGIGEISARMLAAAGYKVAVSARTAKDIERVADSIVKSGGVAVAVACDVTLPASVVVAADRIRAALGPVGVLVNNAGAAESHKFVGHDDELWRRMLDANLNSVYFVTKSVVADMIDANWGRIITVASIAARVGGKYIAAYTASKHGVLGLTRALAVELVAHNITVNAVCPGYVDTAMTAKSISNISQRTKVSAAAARLLLEQMSPQQRLITPQEVAQVVLMLAADASSSITGQAINIDGGAVMS